jgi:tetratricopeptide (TPR) repeat protein
MISTMLEGNVDHPPARLSDSEHDPALERAWRLVGEGRMAEAEVRLDALLERLPESRTAWLMKATARFHRGNYSGGVESSQRAIDLDPSDPRGWVSKGLCLAEAGMNEAAIGCYTSAIQQQDDHATAWRETGKSYGRLGRHEEAVRAFNRSRDADPEALETWYSLALSLVDLGRLDEALACYDKALLIAPRDADTWSARAIIFLRLGIDALQKTDAEQRVPGLFYLREALRNLDNALTIDPEHDLAQRNRIPLVQKFGDILNTIPSLEGMPDVQSLPQQ